CSTAPGPGGRSGGSRPRSSPTSSGPPRSRPAAPSRADPVDRRIFGLETEYGVTCAVPSGRGLSADEVARYLFRKVVAWGRSSNVFLRNGSRLYLDVGSH